MNVIRTALAAVLALAMAASLSACNRRDAGTGTEAAKDGSSMGATGSSMSGQAGAADAASAAASGASR